MSVFAESGITGRTKDVMLSRLIEVAEGNRLRRVGNVTSNMRLIVHELKASPFCVGCVSRS